MIALIARHEAAGLLRQSATWVILAVLAAAYAFLFLRQLEAYIAVQPSLALQDHPPGLSAWLSARFLAPLAAPCLLLGPLFAMRSFSDEFRQARYVLWQVAPLRLHQLVLGKFFGILIVLLIPVLIALTMVALMRLFVPLDLPLLGSAALGLFALSGAATALGLFCSSMTRQPLVASLASLALLAALWLLGTQGGESLSMLAPLSLSVHMPRFFQGLIDSADLVYLLLFISLFLGLTLIRLDSLRHEPY